MKRANAFPQTSCRILANVTIHTSRKGQIRSNSSCKARQILGLPGRRSCGLSSFALCCPRTSTAMWLK